MILTNSDNSHLRSHICMETNFCCLLRVFVHFAVLLLLKEVFPVCKMVNVYNIYHNLVTILSFYQLRNVIILNDQNVVSVKLLKNISHNSLTKGIGKCKRYS